MTPAELMGASYGHADVLERAPRRTTTHLGRRAINAEGQELVGRPLDRHSFTQRWLRSVKYMMPGTSLGIMQLMHPEIGAAVKYQSVFFGEPTERVWRSLPQIFDVVYAKDALAAGKKIRDAHHGIHGSDEKGRSFHALDPETFWWAHATFQNGLLQVGEHYSSRRLDPDDPADEAAYEQLNGEGIEWYGRYGMKMDPVPATHDAFREKFDYIRDNVLEVTPAAEKAIDYLLDRNLPRPKRVPREIWPYAKIPLLPMTDAASVLGIGELPKELRDRLGIPFSDFDQKRLEVIRAGVRRMPDRIATLGYGAIRSPIDRLLTFAK